MGQAGGRQTNASPELILAKRKREKRDGGEGNLFQMNVNIYKKNGEGTLATKAKGKEKRNSLQKPGGGGANL